MKKIKEFFKNHKKITILVILLIVAAIAATFLFINKNKLFNDKKEVSEFSYTRTVTLSKGSLDETVSATGTVESQNVSNVTTSLSYNVKTINVQVGDVVKVGDVICTLDTEDLTSQIEKKTEQLEDTIDKAYENLDKAEDDYDSAASAYETAKAEYASSETTYNTAKAEYDTVYNSVKGYITVVEEKEAAKEQAGLVYNDCLQNPASYVDGTTYLDEASAISGYETLYNDAVNALMNAENDLETAKNRVNFSDYEKALTSAEQALNSAATAKSNAKTKAENAEDTYDQALENYNNADEDDDIEELKEELAKCTIKAETSGTITSLNVTVGSRASGTIATIQDTNSLKVSVSFDEYDIQVLEVGMKATITSDATDSEMTGYLSQLSPVASTQGMGSSSSTFSAEVIIDEADASLLIGMNAKVVITISSISDVYTVPYDAVEEVEGKYYIYVQNENQEFEQVEVNVGEENDYYIEISGDNLKDGMVVRASANAEEAEETVDSSMMDMFDMGGGMPSGDMGGSMPSGGGGGGGSMPSGGFGGPNG